MKYFYAGMQRSGTKSFGDFFRKNNYRVFSWKQVEDYGVSERWFYGKWVELLDSGIFEEFDVFEDGPFFDPNFVAFLSNNIKDSSFVYFERPSEDWYKSMVTHSNGLSLGDLKRHAYIYDRLEEMAFVERETGTRPQKLPIIGMKAHYEAVYKRHKYQIKAKLEPLDSSRVFFGDLYDNKKFEKMCSHFCLDVGDKSEQKSHQTPNTFTEIIHNHQYLFG